MTPMNTSQFVVEEELGDGHTANKQVRHRTTGKTKQEFILTLNL
jgi:hypothetical protein